MWRPELVENESKFIKVREMTDHNATVPTYTTEKRLTLVPLGVPTLRKLANIALPPPPPPSPGQGRSRAGRTGNVEYGKWRAVQLENHIAQKVKQKAEPQIQKILALESWDDKQEAIDELFERVEAELGEEESVLKLHPRFGEWVETSLEKYLEQVANADDSSKSNTMAPIAEEPDSSESSESSSSEGSSSSDSSDDSEDDEHNVAFERITAEDDENAVPVFVDLYDPNDECEEDPPDKPDDVSRICNIPKILHPLAISPTEKTGRMVEEWQISAHPTAKRIMLRQCTRDVARMLTENKSSRVYLHGREGTGKTAVLATAVAAARKSGMIVLYMPDGARLRRHGYYIEPSTTHKGIYDLPLLSQEVCTEFLECHEKDLEGMFLSAELKDTHFSATHKKKIPEALKDDLSLVGLLRLGKDETALAPMCFSAVIEFLSQQEEKAFVIAMDEFNCYHDYSPNDDHYFHMNYDVHVVKAIPYELITLFKPGLEAMGIFHNHDDEVLPKLPKPIKRGGVIVATTECHAIARRYTDGLTDYARHAETHQYLESPIKVVEVPRYSRLEAEHMLSHYELIGVGKLRFDRGESVMDENEVGYLRMVSGGVGQKFMDACMIE